ncbi:MAG: MBL fold metallo-hydrolase [Acidobacteriota bacterium]|nr:MBL fold metallo-hydrolase [Acidobacteriota bacterium]
MIFGDFRIEIIPDTEFRLDGGAMFGIVPRVLWERACPPDELNRIRLQTNCLFVETATERILIETGIGEKWTEKQAKIYGINRQKTFADSLFEKTGYKSEDITIVINTHLHLDHAGGNTKMDENGKIISAFPNARYFVSEAEHKHAENPTERDRGSYIADDWRPPGEAGQLELKPENYEVVPGLTMQQMRGHNGSMQTVRLTTGGETFYSFADLIPTTAHLPLSWVMGYDLFPLETLENKKKLLPQAVKENWLCFFYHDPETSLCRLTEENGKLKANKIEI